MRVLHQWVRDKWARATRPLLWLAVVAVGLVVVVGLAAAVRVDNSDHAFRRVLGEWVEPDRYARAPACDGFARETLATLGPLPASERSAGQAHTYCGWPLAADGFLYVMVNVLLADGAGASQARRWLHGEPGEAVATPQIGDAAKLERHDEGCTLQFRHSNLIARIGYVADGGGDCGSRVVALSAEFASRLPR